MAKASAPPGVPTPICRIKVVRAAISPSLRAKSRRDFPQELSHLNGPNFLGREEGRREGERRGRPLADHT